FTPGFSVTRPKSNAVSGDCCADGVLVDAVAGETLELVAQLVGWSRRIARWKLDRIAVELDACESVGPFVLERDLPTEPRAEPAGQKVRLRFGSGDLDPLHVRDPGPQGRELRPPP